MIRILIRTSRWAIWSRRLGSVAVPLLVIPALMHRSRGINSDSFGVVFGFAMFIAALAFLTGVIAFIRLWMTGDRGWGRATTGLVFGLICMAPLFYGTVQYMRYPAVNDVTTDWQDPPALMLTGRGPPDDRLKDEVIAAFPNAVNRNYQLSTDIVFAQAVQLVTENGWDIRLRREPGAQARPGQLNATATTLMGWRDEVSISIGNSGNGTRVAVRSKSAFGPADLGENGRRIESFLLTLDQKISEWRRDNPQSGG